MNTIYLYIKNNMLIVEVTCFIGKRVLGSFYYPLTMSDALAVILICDTCKRLIPNIVVTYSVEVAMSRDEVTQYIFPESVLYPMQEICA